MNSIQKNKNQIVNAHTKKPPRSLQLNFKLNLEIYHERNENLSPTVLRKIL